MLVLSNRLKALRINNNLTQEQLGILLHLTKSSVSNYENEKRMLSIETLISISNLYNVDINYLVGLEKIIKLNDKEVVRMSTEEYELIQQIKKHKKLYYDLMNNMNNTIKQIENKLYY